MDIEKESYHLLEKRVAEMTPVMEVLLEETKRITTKIDFFVKEGVKILLFL